MPRYEKAGRDKDHFFEVLRDGTKVWIAKGTRAKGEAVWRQDANSPTCTKPNVATFYDDKIAGVVKQRYLLVGDATPELDVKLAEVRAMIASEPVQAMLSEADELRALFEARNGTVSLVGSGSHSEGKFLEITVKGKVVEFRTGKVGSKGRTKQVACSDAEDAMATAVREMSSYQMCFGYKPA